MTPCELHGQHVVLIAVAPGDVPELRRILHTPQVHQRWGDEDATPQWPFDDASATRYTVFVDGAVRGLIQYTEETEPEYRHATLDIFLDPAVHGRHIGRDALYTLARHLLTERGHHRLTIDPAADNEAAIGCYRAVGFRTVGILREYEHDIDGPGWHDGLLMDLLAHELVQPT